MRVRERERHAMNLSGVRKHRGASNSVPSIARKPHLALQFQSMLTARFAPSKSVPPQE